MLLRHLPNRLEHRFKHCVYFFGGDEDSRQFFVGREEGNFVIEENDHGLEFSLHRRWHGARIAVLHFLFRQRPRLRRPLPERARQNAVILFCTQVALCVFLVVLAEEIAERRDDVPALGLAVAGDVDDRLHAFDAVILDDGDVVALAGFLLVEQCRHQEVERLHAFISHFLLAFEEATDHVRIGHREEGFIDFFLLGDEPLFDESVERVIESGTLDLRSLRKILECDGDVGEARQVDPSLRGSQAKRY